MCSTWGFAVGGEDEPATLRKLGKRVSAIRFAYLGCRTARVRSRSVQDLSPSDSDLSQIGWRRGSHSGFREGDSRRSDRRPDRAKPQVTRVIGVLDPYRLLRPPATNACEIAGHRSLESPLGSPMENRAFASSEPEASSNSAVAVCARATRATGTSEGRLTATLAGLSGLTSDPRARRRRPCAPRRAAWLKWGGSAVPHHAFEEEVAERPELVEAGSGTLYHA